MAYYAYIRVSTESQTVENQRMAIKNWCKHNNIDSSKIIWVEEKISGMKQVEKRRLGQLLAILEKGDVLICTELSRLGRTLYMIMSTLQSCLDNNVVVYSIKENFILRDDVPSKVLVFAFGLAAEIERDLISQRTIEGLERARADGSVLGRPKGSKNKSTKLSGQQETVAELLKRNNSYSAVARAMKVNRTTLMRFCKANNLIKAEKNRNDIFSVCNNFEN